MTDERTIDRIAVGGNVSSDHQHTHYADLHAAQRLQLSRAEMTWVQNYRRPDRTTEAVVSLSCGMQSVPHLMLVLVTLFRLLDLDFVATAGPQFCCGKPYQDDEEDTTVGNRVAATSIKRFASWQPTINVQCCGSCYTEFSGHVNRMRDTGQAPFEVVHLTKYLLDVLRRLGDNVPWKRTVPRRVLLHAEGAEVHHSKVVQRNDVISTLELVPGVEYVGLVTDPTAGKPCQSKEDSEASILSDLTPEQYREVLAELRTQADAVGADAILTHHHKCHREWSRFSTPRLPVIYYPALITEALGVTVPDRFQMLWHMKDLEHILEATREWWSSWGISEPDARDIVHKIFDPAYASAIHHCPCEGSCLVDPGAGSARPADACTAASGLLHGSRV